MALSEAQEPIFMGALFPQKARCYVDQAVALILCCPGSKAGSRAANHQLFQLFLVKLLLKLPLFWVLYKIV